MTLAFLFEDFIDGNQDARLLYISKAIINSRPEEFHRGRESHIGINQRWYVIAQFTNLTVQNQVILLERMTTEESVQFCWVGLQFQRFHRDNQMFLVIKILLQEIKYHVASLAHIGRIHRHLSKIVSNVRTNDGQSAQSIP